MTFPTQLNTGIITQANIFGSPILTNQKIQCFMSGFQGFWIFHARCGKRRLGAAASCRHLPCVLSLLDSFFTLAARATWVRRAVTVTSPGSFVGVRRNIFIPGFIKLEGHGYFKPLFLRSLVYFHHPKKGHVVWITRYSNKRKRKSRL